MWARACVGVYTHIYTDICICRDAGTIDIYTYVNICVYMHLHVYRSTPLFSRCRKCGVGCVRAAGRSGDMRV